MELESENVERRLAAILSADAVGYTRLMADDEVETVRAIGACRELIASRVAEHRGRVVDSPGDNVLAEFPSALDAIRCSVAIQSALAERNAPLPEERRMPFRIGVHLGDVLVEGDRIYGDGVNIASRLEGLAEAGGICLSATVHDQVRAKVEPEFEDLGTREMKNVPHPVRVFRVRLGSAAGSAPRSDAEPSFKGRPAVAVLPFDSPSRDPDDESFADAISGDLITLLSAWRAFPVIARNSSFSFKGRAVDVKQLSRDLGARYVVEGTVRTAGNRVRVTAQLIDATTGHHVWAERYDRPLDEIFEVQDELTEAIVSALQPALRVAEAERARRSPPESLEAWAIVNRAWTELQTDIANREATEATLAAVDRALDLDPDYALAHAVRALALSLLRISGADDPLAVANRALARAPDDPQLLQIYGATMGNLGRTDDAVRALERSLVLDPNNAQARAGLGVALIFKSRMDEALDHIDQAMRLSPRDPLTYNWLAYRALGALGLGRLEEAILNGQESVRRTPSRTGWLGLAIALARAGRLDEGREAYREFEAYAERATISQLEPFVRLFARAPEEAELLIEAMRKVGFES